jgi:hypothetical protein
MSMMGFRKERIGGLSYWHRPPFSGVDAAADVAGTMQLPLVVVHGLGAGCEIKQCCHRRRDHHRSRHSISLATQPY